jgi:glutamyl-tRNA synthetase
MDTEVVTRFPPSPTGLLQAGNARTAVFNYLFAKKHGGKFILRIEDTDRERSSPQYEENILETMQWLGFTHDEFYRQSDNAPRHAQALRELIERDLAYVSKETPTEEGQRTEVIRLRNPNTTITFTDVIRGPISIDTTDLGDFIIGRSIDEPLYHFGVVVDDMDEGVTHVIRGEDHIPNTPRQILIQRALGVVEPPVYAHLPLVLGQDKQKLSKRRGAKAMTQYRDEGFLPEAMINYLTLLGWHPEGEQEVFTLPELVEQFTLARIQKSAGIFDEVKLRWFNHEHIKRLSLEDYTPRLRLFLRLRNVDESAYFAKITGLLKERYETLGDAAEALAMGEFSFMDEAAPTKELLLQGAKADEAAVKSNLEALREILAAHELFTAEAVKEAIFPFATAQGRASVLWPMRVALSGKEKSPDPFMLAELLGKEETLRRIEAALQLF